MRAFHLRQTQARLTMTIPVLKEFTNSRTSFSQNVVWNLNNAYKLGKCSSKPR